MRTFLIAGVTLLFCSCGNQPAGKPDQMDTASTSSVAVSGVFEEMTALEETRLPVLITADSAGKLDGYLLSEEECAELLPGDFEFSAYNSVKCFGWSVISADVKALWFCLRSPGDYEEAPESVDIMLVIYTKDGKPIDVCAVASASLGYSYSYVRNDAVITIEVDAMEEIKVTTSDVKITENGFMADVAFTTTFQPNETVESQKFMNEYILSHKQ